VGSVRRLLVLWVSIATTSAAVLPAQQPTFRADTQLVSVYATVTDRHTRLVTDLAAEDFEVLDDGKPQPLALFENSAQPVAAVLMLDTSINTTLSFDRIREAAEEFVVRLRPDDLARVCAFNDKIQFGAPFTGDRDLLAKEVREIDYGNGARLHDALAESVEALKAMDRRRVILLFTDGDDTGSRTKLSAIVRNARAADVMIYAIGLEGREFDGDKFVDSDPDPDLEKLAVETGGAYFELERTRDLGSTFTRVAEELHSQYALAFTSTVEDGRVHKVAVRLRNRRLKVRARQSYMAAAARTDASRTDAR
jgi:Ca-activated chloride channel homolog